MTDCGCAEAQFPADAHVCDIKNSTTGNLYLLLYSWLPITQNLLRTTNPENVGSIGQMHFKIDFLKGENNSFEKKGFERYSNRNR